MLDSEISMQKCAYVASQGSRCLEIAKRWGVKTAFGTDVGSCPDEQSQEFVIRAEVLSPAEIIHSATVIGAELVRMVDKIGVVKPGAFADLLVVDGDPLEDVRLLVGQGKHLAAIMKEGRFYKNVLAPSMADAPGVRRARELEPAE